MLQKELQAVKLYCQKIFAFSEENEKGE